MAAGNVDAVDFIAPEATGVRPEKQMKPDDREADANGGNPSGLAKEKFESLRHARQLNKSARPEQANLPLVKYTENEIIIEAYSLDATQHYKYGLNLGSLLRVLVNYS
jgi:hypothetical protein